jgi:hypothetical protein
MKTLAKNGIDRGGWLLCKRGAGSEEREFLILIFKNSDNHGEGDLLLWIMKLWIFFNSWI